MLKTEINMETHHFLNILLLSICMVEILYNRDCCTNSISSDVVLVA